jgi:hypothetical protein
MHTSKEILEFIDNMIDAMLKRPKMYASTPETLEEILTYFDIIRYFILSEANSEAALESKYADFLRDRGYNAMTFTAAARFPKPLTNEDLDLFQETSAFFKEYINYRDSHH